MYQHKISIAPMLDWTDRHYRYMARLISRNQLLYTEMVTTGAIIHGKGDYLAYNEQEHPVALQLGGSNPVDLALCAKKAQEYGYDKRAMAKIAVDQRFNACANPEALFYGKPIDVDDVLNSRPVADPLSMLGACLAVPRAPTRCSQPCC